MDMTHPDTTRYSFQWIQQESPLRLVHFPTVSDGHVKVIITTSGRVLCVVRRVRKDVGPLRVKTGYSINVFTTHIEDLTWYYSLPVWGGGGGGVGWRGRDNESSTLDMDHHSPLLTGSWWGYSCYGISIHSLLYLPRTQGVWCLGNKVKTLRIRTRQCIVFLFENKITSVSMKPRTRIIVLDEELIN